MSPTPSPIPSPTPGSSRSQTSNINSGRRNSVGSSTSGTEGSGSDTNKENRNRECWYEAKHRNSFSRGEEETIVQYFLRNGGYSSKGGNTVWIKMGKEGICTGRTWQSLKERFEKHID